MSSVLSVVDLRKVYGDTVAVDGVSFSVGVGEIVGLLGPNGAGKTTTINMVLGVLEPSSGTIFIEEMSLASHRSLALQRTNFAAVYAPLPGNLTVYQNLRIFGLLYGVKTLTARIQELLAQFELEKFRNTKSGVLSSGEQTRLCLAKAMLNRPQLLLLDEPTASLDPSTARDIRARIREFAAPGGCGVLWTSHNMHEVEEVCDRVLFLSRGKVLLEGDPKTLPRDHGKDTLEELFITVAREPLTLELAEVHIGRVLAILLRQIYLMRGSFSRVMPLFAWVAIDVVLWGFISRYLNSVSHMDFTPSLLGAVLLWDFFIRVMQGVTTAFFEDVWSRNFLNIFATPLTIPEYLGGLVITSIATSAVGLVVMLVLAGSIFGLSFFALGLTLIPFVMALFLFGIALGVLGCALVLRWGPSAEWFIWPIPAFLSPFAAVFYPLATLPPWMQWVAKLLPPSYVFEGLRSMIGGGAASQGLLLLSVCLAVGYILAACWCFTRVFQQAVRSGLIARYSAESLT